MGRTQYITVGFTLVLLAVTYWGCPVRPPEMEEGFARGPLEATGIETLIREARSSLTPAQMATLSTLDERLETQTEDSARIDLMRQLAGEWYRAGQPAISGVYARRIADVINTENAWGIAGTTFSLCLRQEGINDKTRQFCGSQAEKAYQAAISLAPTNPEHRINLALTYTDNPQSDNPMKGILMLRELEEKFPGEPKVYLTLAQLAIRTNQYERAAERLRKAVALAPDNPDAVCNLAKVLETLNRSEESATFARRCNELVSASR